MMAAGIFAKISRPAARPGYNSGAWDGTRQTISNGSRPELRI
jgi:hypothetical protein